MNKLSIQSMSVFYQVNNFVVLTLGNRHKRKAVNIQTITETLNDLYHKFKAVYDDDYEYSSAVEAFLGATFAVVGDIPNGCLQWDIEMAEEFLTYLYSYETIVKRDRNAEIYQEQANEHQLRDYVCRLLAKHSKSLIVMVTLSYNYIAREEVSLDDFQEHIKKLRDRISNKQTCFEHLKGHAWAIEQGLGKGVHCHLWLLYDGHKRQRDSYIGKTVGETWLEITKGDGEYYNSNNPEDKLYYEARGKLGIGRINRNDRKQIKNALKTALYLTKPEKSEQHLSVKPKGMRTFGKGEFVYTLDYALKANIKEFSKL